jgi:hypothetical protein
MSTNERLDGIAPAPTEDDDDSDYYEGSVTALPRLGRGVLWSDVLADIERDNRGREAA